jgi:uncharacterized protein
MVRNEYRRRKTKDETSSHQSGSAYFLLSPPSPGGGGGDSPFQRQIIPFADALFSSLALVGGWGNGWKGRLLYCFVFLLTACSTAAPAPALPGSVALQPSATTVATAVPTIVPTVEPTALPTATALPTMAPTATTVPTVAPTATTAPPSPTADPYAEWAPYTIDGLRARSYGEGEIRVLRVLSRTPQFTRELFEYTSDGLRITGQLTRPRGEGPWPVVILNHGYFPLAVYRTGYDTQHASDYLAARGYLSLAPDFRSHAGSDKAPNIFKAGHVIDTLNLIPLAQKLPEAARGKVFMWGHSNGGEITLKAMLVSDQIAAGLIYAPASSFLEDSYYAYSRGQTLWNPNNTADYPVTPDESPELYRRLSPYYHLEYLQAPVQWHHGTNDPVWPEWSIVPHERLIALGKQSELFLYEGGKHALTGAQKELYLQRTYAFFEGLHNAAQRSPTP